jgi:four-jointed box protein 1
MAFVVGILVGVLVPLYASAALEIESFTPASLTSEPSSGKVSFLVGPDPLYPPEVSSNSIASNEKRVEWRRLVEGIYWSPEVENSLPRGFTDADVHAWRTMTNHTPIVRMEEGCGRMQNRLVVFERGARSCARYRQNMDQVCFLTRESTDYA